mmetsp:Transcript_68112/g.158058  ORF Transcript_68112/g.158058 Transcript_68112/m.158058 type:complete len:202 (+) Transcript_68112:479-1084(+)
MKPLANGPRCTNERSPRVRDGNAVALLAKGQGFTTHGDAADFDLPEAKFGLVHWRPLQLRVQPAGIVAPEKDLARQLVRAREEVAKARFAEVAEALKLAKEAEFGVHSKALKTEAQDAIELEGHEGLLRHLRREHDPHAGAVLACPLRCKADSFSHEFPGDFTGAVRDRHLVTGGRIGSDCCAAMIKVHGRGRELAVEAVV